MGCEDANRTGVGPRPLMLPAVSFTVEELMEVTGWHHKKVRCAPKSSAGRCFRVVDVIRSLYVSVYASTFFRNYNNGRLHVSPAVAPDFARVHWPPNTTSDLKRNN